MQIISGTPPIILDVAHNPQAVKALRGNLDHLALAGRLHAVFGILTDKDLAAIVEIIAPKLASWHLVNTVGPRGQSAEQLKSRLARLGIKENLCSCGSVAAALQSAKSQAGEADTILVFGSFLVVGEFLENLNKTDPIELI
jgi:dihydrofolate synthase/folylpolyglutamate synthase